jgi:uncharacterized phage protein (TIGR01671 family)
VKSTIEFRYWDEEEKEMIYFSERSYSYSDGRFLIFDNAKHGYIDCGLDEDNREIEQFTGRTDKNKKKIFGGDIIKSRDYHGERLGYVDYPEGHTAWFLCGVDGISDEYLLNQNEIEIIGNIHENPELLEVQDVK